MKVAEGPGTVEISIAEEDRCARTVRLRFKRSLPGPGRKTHHIVGAPHPLSLLAEQVLSIETKAFPGRALVTNADSAPKSHTGTGDKSWTDQRGQGLHKSETNHLKPPWHSAPQPRAAVELRLAAHGRSSSQRFGSRPFSSNVAIPQYPGA